MFRWVRGTKVGCTYRYRCVCAWILAVPMSGSAGDMGTAGTVVSILHHTGTVSQTSRILICSAHQILEKRDATSKVMPLPASMVGDSRAVQVLWEFSSLTCAMVHMPQQVPCPHGENPFTNPLHQGKETYRANSKSWCCQGLVPTPHPTLSTSPQRATVAPTAPALRWQP